MLVLVALLAFAQAAQTIAPGVAAASSPGDLVHQPRLFALGQDTVAYVPAGAGPHPPLLVLLHGAGRGGLEMIEHFEGEADERGIVLLAPVSRGLTWDTVAIAEEPPSPDSPLANSQAHRFTDSVDAHRIEAAIAALSKIIPVDRAHAVLAGFSDGATFALAMGMSRNHPFSAVIAWSPGIAIETVNPMRGRRVFISHGRKDLTLKFEVSCGEIVPLLRSEGAKVIFLPFDGGHEAPQPVKDAFLDAAFGSVTGAALQPLPKDVPTCSVAGTREMQ